MTYKAIGIMSGSSMDGLDIVFVQFEENKGDWQFEILKETCIPYTDDWKEFFQSAPSMSAKDFFQGHIQYGKFIADQVNAFVVKNNLQYKTQFIGFHGHTVFHEPANGFSIQLGDGATIAANTGINTITELRNLDVALGGQGAPIVPIGEKLLFPEYDFFVNLGGICNLSFHDTVKQQVIAFDVCPNNRILNKLAAETGKTFDEKGRTASFGKVNAGLLTALNHLDYYQLDFPKSLSNQFGDEQVLPLLNSFNISAADRLRTYTEHVVYQLVEAIKECTTTLAGKKLYVTGGGAYNIFLVESLKQRLDALSVEMVVPDAQIIEYKEALIMALLAVLRWREESTTIPSVTGARKAGIGGACWMGQDA